MRLYIANFFLMWVVVFNVNVVLAKNTDLPLSVEEADAKIQKNFKYYNDGQDDLLFKNYTSRSKEKLNEMMVLDNFKEKKLAIGKVVESHLLLSERASPNLLYLFYQVNYERSNVMEFFCLTREQSSKEVKITIDQVDIDNQMMNEGEVDDRVHQAERKVQEFRALYNQEMYESFYKRVDFGSESYTRPKDEFVSMMSKQNKDLGKYVSSQRLFSRSKSNGVVLTYLSQYEKYAVIELWGFVRNSPSEPFKLRVYEFF